MCIVVAFSTEYWRSEVACAEMACLRDVRDSMLAPVHHLCCCSWQYHPLHQIWHATSFAYGNEILGWRSGTERRFLMIECPDEFIWGCIIVRDDSLWNCHASWRHWLAYTTQETALGKESNRWNDLLRSLIKGHKRWTFLGSLRYFVTVGMFLHRESKNKTPNSWP